MRGQTTHLAELRRLPREGSFLFRDHLPAPGGLATYFHQRGLIRRVGKDRNRLASWQMTDAGRRLAEAKV